MDGDPYHVTFCNLQDESIDEPDVPQPIDNVTSAESHRILPHNVETFSALVENGLELFGRVPFSEFKLIDFPFKDEVVSEQFFALLGPGIRALDIRVKIRRGPTDFLRFDGSSYGDVLFRLAPSLEKLVIFPFPELPILKSEGSKLSHLKIIHFKEWSFKPYVYSVEFLTSLFECTSKLEQVWISVGVKYTLNQSGENILHGLRNSGRHLTISKLAFAHLKKRHLEILNQAKGLKLTSLRVEAFFQDFDSQLLVNFLVSQALTLKELYFRVPSTDNNIFQKLDFPVIPFLRKLDCDLSPKYLTAFSCRGKFPNLRTLQIFGAFNTSFPFASIFSEGFPSSSVTSLHFRPGLIVTGLIPSLANVFPSVKNLTVSIVQASDLTDIWIHWPQLVRLEVHFGKQVVDMDSVISGLSRQDCDRLLLEMQKDRPRRNAFGNRGPYISELQGL